MQKYAFFFVSLDIQNKYLENVKEENHKDGWSLSVLCQYFFFKLKCCSVFEVSKNVS